MMPIANGGRVALREVPQLPVERFREEIVAAVGRGGRLSAFFGRPDGDGTLLLALLSSSERSGLAAVSARVGDAYPALTPDCPQAHWFEREIHESCGVAPLGHPWLKP
ncbi:MAG: NADH-quinone oxidoreductase subunit C, partial [bacterium]|nr:NADH-quinone oxidoreductase subunit C [bacterium]